MRKKIALISLFLLAAPLASFASFIQLDTKLKPQVENNTIRAVISMVNKGDEPAYDLQTEVILGEDHYFSHKHPKIEPNKTFIQNMPYPIKAHIPGNYPLIVIIHYADANQYPFSALSGTTFSIGKAGPPSEIFGEIKTLSFATKAMLEVTLKNRGESEIQASTSFLVPKEFKSSAKKQEIRIPGKSTKKTAIEIENFSALGGSSYQIYAVCTYEQNGFHQTVMVPGWVKVIKHKAIIGLNHSTIGIVLLLLIFIYIAVQYKYLKKNKTRSDKIYLKKKDK